MLNVEPRNWVQLQKGRVPKSWQSCGDCQSCGPVLLPGTHRNHGVLSECPWCSIRNAGYRIPTVEYVAMRLRTSWTQLPVYLSTRSKQPTTPYIAPDDRQGTKLICNDVFNDDHATKSESAPSPVNEIPHHPHDTRWIEKMLSHINNASQRNALYNNYGKVFQAAWDAEPNIIRKDGVARFAANCDLRDRVKAMKYL